jgi:type IX secretion system PorP/SprF family membrane protein
MRQPILFAFLVFASTCGYAQQKPIYTQYVLNNYIINPAITGIENYTDVKISHRQQWTGIDGAPVTTYVSVQGPIGKKDYRTNATSFDIPGENPRGHSFIEQYTAAEAHHGVGGIMLSDKTGYINRWGVYGTYAYHKGLTTKTTLSAGFMAGITSVSVDASKVRLADPNTVDPAIYNNSTASKMKPELAAGLWLYSAEYFVGVSVLNIVPGKIKFGADSALYGSSLAPHFVTTAGYKTFLTEDISLLPSVMIQFIKPMPLQVYVNAKAQYQDKFWLGASYRFGDQLGGFAGMAGFNVSNTFNIGYSYDISTSQLRNYSRNTHEFIIGFLLGNKYADTCPRAAW